MRRAVFLDRDGVINRAFVRAGKPFPPSSLAELEILEDVPGALDRLHRAGFMLIVVTNQPDVARGTLAPATLDAIHGRLGEALPIDAFRTCCHDDRDGCRCRKPAPGLLTDAAKEFDIDLSASFMVGDRWRDVEAGQAAGCRVVFIDRGYDERRPTSFEFLAASLGEAASAILADQVPTTDVMESA
jgi:D-glycero-D-manno-heptose 1,7-bisphosphate phosphatase